QWRGLLSLQLQRRARLRPHRAGRHLRAGLPADRRSARPWRAAIAAEDPARRNHHPMTAALEDLGAHIAASMTNAVEGRALHVGELTINVRADQIYAVIKFLHDDPRCRFTTLIDICGVDYPEREKRFDLV